MRTASSVWVLLAWIAFSSAWPAAAQTVYRCGPDGRSYSQQPCDGGGPVRVDDSRSEAQRREAHDVAGRHARVARELERERLKTQPAPTTAAGFDGRRASASEASSPAKPKKRGKSPKTSEAEFRAAVPRPTKTRTASKSG